MDPYHMYLARRPSAARSAESNPAKQQQQQQQQDAGSASKSSSVDSKSQQSSYIGGEVLSPISTTSTDQATITSLADSSSSSDNAATLQHRLPEFEHFRSSPLMPEFYPRTSEFFSQGKRRSSVVVNSDANRANATAAAGNDSTTNAQRGNQQKKSDTFHLPLVFEESESLKGEQLPVRLGLAPPCHSHGFSSTDIIYKARVGYGYYFYTPPPTSPPSSSSKSSLPTSLRRRNTDTSEKSSTLLIKTSLPSSTIYSTSPASISPGVASSPHRARANSSMTSLSHSYPASAGSRLPPPSPDCWHPDSYFTTTRCRVKGKVREYKYHAFPSSVVPYWHGYNTETIEAEMWTHLSVNAALHGNTLRDFPEGSRPCRVLDLGCGRGVWCLDMARNWKSSEFVGLDIVPIQPSMDQLEDADLHHRVSWVIANFLEPLPFPDASFDYVHIRFVLPGVPEDKWVDIFSEARRILAPGGVLEVVEGNYSFFGHASLVDVNELKDLEQGRIASRKGSGVKLPKRLKVLNDASDSADVDAIEIVLERMMHRRFINPNPLSVVPSALLLPGFSKVANGNPRHIPVYAESSAQRARARAAVEGANQTSSDNATSSQDEQKKQGKFTSRGQIGNPLNSQFAMTDLDLFCALVILQQLDHFSSSRELVWAEAEEEKRCLDTPQPELAKMDNTRRFGQGNPAALKPFAHPWKSKDQFFKAMDTWIEATRASADTEYMLRKYLGWEQAHEDLTVEGRKHAERRRKMSVSSATVIPSLGMDQIGLIGDNGGAGFSKAVMDDEEERQNALAALSEMDQTLSGNSGGAFAIATTQVHHEAPARLQTTRSSAPDIRIHVEARDDGGKPEDKGKRKKSKRPSSSGGVSSTATSLSGGMSRSRAFGRGGSGGSVPLPDASAFMAGYAFASPAIDGHSSLFRGPATKASIIASSRSARKGSSGKSLSDRSSTSGKTEREDGSKGRSTDTVESRMTSSPGTAYPPHQPRPQRQQDMTGISPAAAYAATLRISHGLEEEHSMQDTAATAGDDDKRHSRPISPASTCPAPGSNTVLGSRPAGAPGRAESRSVSMPVTSITTRTGSLRIAEPLNRPSKEDKTRPSSSAKAVAMIGFYNCTGFLATA
ncbi:uncharacterized protein MEPE_01062 [Melanopsichium pennsylvanicum]|uniref:Methyltransferase domain-containing protein n=2 Tax=Melanopsichium pennsylvanicum TaxID=63383 RepID=A0AAJ4XHZ7_9BASI|nr:hypothetical protein BN887_00482 [Melanopsichium pennsylvanicum 4]SNX82356.1 uncharacterized protein MEPE_01062 [Melanopsichium pennsylvanicum]